MVVGLYMMKYPFRKLLGFLMPLFKNTNPNHLSYALIPLGVLTAVCYASALNDDRPVLYLVGIGLLFLRLVLATLDGQVAVTYNKSTIFGDLVNRITPEICDLMLIPTIVASQLEGPENRTIAVLSLAVSWGIPFFGYFGAPSGLPVQSIGPVGQTDRVAALMVCSLLQFLSLEYGWGHSFMHVFLMWVVGGGFVTLGLRLFKNLKAARSADAKRS